jgi:hypothetical protein
LPATVNWRRSTVCVCLDHLSSLMVTGQTGDILLYDSYSGDTRGGSPGMSAVSTYIHDPVFTFSGSDGAGGLEVSQLAMSISAIHALRNNE